MISTDLVNSIYHHARLTERAIGVDFNSDKVTAVYGLLEELSRGEIAKVQLATELKARIDTMKNRMKQIMSVVNAVKDKRPLLDEAMRLKKQTELAVAMLESLENG